MYHKKFDGVLLQQRNLILKNKLFKFQFNRFHNLSESLTLITFLGQVVWRRDNVKPELNIMATNRFLSHLFTLLRTTWPWSIKDTLCNCVIVVVISLRSLGNIPAVGTLQHRLASFVSNWTCWKQNESHRECSYHRLFLLTNSPNNNRLWQLMRTTDKE